MSLYKEALPFISTLILGRTVQWWASNRLAAPAARIELKLTTWHWLCWLMALERVELVNAVSFGKELGFPTAAQSRKGEWIYNSSEL